MRGRLLLCLLIAAGCCAPALRGQGCADHIVVLYDFTGPVLDQADRVARANRYLSSLLFENVALAPATTDDVVDRNDLAQHGYGRGLFHAGDCLSMFTFGLEDAALKEALPREQSPQRFWYHFARYLVHPSTPPLEAGADAARARRYVEGRLPGAGTPRQYSLALPRYALPALLSLMPDAGGQRTLIVWVSGLYLATDEGGTLDQAVAALYVPNGTAVLARAQQDARDYFQINPDLLRIRVGGYQGIRLQVLEVAPPERPSLSFAGGQPDLREVARGAWELSVPPLRWLAPARTAELFSPVSGTAVLQSDEGGRHEPPVPVPERPGSRYAGAAARISLGPGEPGVPGPNPRLSVVWRVDYRPPGSLGLRLPLAVATPALQCAVTTYPRHINLGLVLATAAALTAVVLFILACTVIPPGKEALKVTAEPRKMPPDMEGLTDPTVVVDRYEYARLLWVSRGASETAWRLRNVHARFNRRALVVAGRFSPGEADPDLSAARYTLAIVDESGKRTELGPGEEFRLELKPRGPGARVAVWIHLGDEQQHVPEPVYPNKLRCRFDLILRDRRGDEFHLLGGFQIEENPGPMWVAVDPGTSGSCVTLSAGPEAVTMVGLQPNLAGEARVVMSSFVYVCCDSHQARQEHAMEHPRAGHGPLAFLCGERALSYLGKADRCFHSPKRLIGYDERRQVSYDGVPTEIRGRDAVSMIVRFLLEAAKSANEKLSAPPAPLRKINKLVVAVPNMFTPLKVKEMKDACRVGPIRRVEHIYEAEATLMYYLWKTGERLTPEELQSREARRKADGEYVLSFDFGGSSLNLTYARVRQRGEHEEKPIQVHVFQRLGYALGGDTLDWEIGEILWDQAKMSPVLAELPSLLADPRAVRFLRPELREPWCNLRAQYRLLCERVKIRCSEDWAEHRERPWNPFYEAPWHVTLDEGDQITPEKIVRHERMQRIFRIIREAVAEMKAFCDKRKEWRGVDTLLFSGRSVQFPEVMSEAASELLRGEPGGEGRLVRVDLGAQRKTCVSQGAAYWSAMQAVIELSRGGTYAHYGVVRWTSPNAREFVELIPAGKEFAADHTCSKTLSNQFFRFNGGQIRFYQVMSSDPRAAILSGDRRYAYGMLCEMFDPQSANNPVSELKLTLTENDTFSAGMTCAGSHQEQHGEVRIGDVLADQDESARWLVAPGGGPAAAGAHGGA
jgi:hypothetical protein